MNYDLLIMNCRTVGDEEVLFPFLLFFCFVFSRKMRIFASLMGHYASVIIFAILTLSSAVASIGSYRTTEGRIVDELNRALTLTVSEEQQPWLTADTIRACRQLQITMGGRAELLCAADATFGRHLTIPGLSGLAEVRMRVIDDGDTAERGPKEEAGVGLCSDTVVWHSERLGASVALRSYARCSAATVFGMSDQRLPLTLLVAAMLWAVGSVAVMRRRQSADKAFTVYSTDGNNQVAAYNDGSSDTVAAGSFGGLVMSADGETFRDAEGRDVRLTPMQHRLMQMFFRADGHRLAKTAICDELWPKKEDASETLYALVKRLKPVLEAHSDLRIESDRGRAYVLTAGRKD